MPGIYCFDQVCQLSVSNTQKLKFDVILVINTTTITTTTTTTTAATTTVTHNMMVSVIKLIYAFKDKF